MARAFLLPEKKLDLTKDVAFGKLALSPVR
jgi:hypothetical protein